MRGITLLLLLALVASLVAIPRPARWSGVRPLEARWALPTLNLSGRLAAIVMPAYGYGTSFDYSQLLSRPESLP